MAESYSWTHFDGMLNGHPTGDTGFALQLPQNAPKLALTVLEPSNLAHNGAVFADLVSTGAIGIAATASPAVLSPQMAQPSHLWGYAALLRRIAQIIRATTAMPPIIGPAIQYMLPSAGCCTETPYFMVHQFQVVPS